MKREFYMTFILSLFILNAVNAQIGWVGNRFPDSGTSTAGSNFTVYVQVYKAGVTEPAGQGGGITCEIYYGEVTAFGGAWSNISSISMAYNVDIGNNDEYMGDMNLAVGMYEYICRCSDNGGASWFSDTDGFNGQLTVDAATPVTLSYFNAKLKEDAVVLDWVTESEDNNSHFEIEKSTDSRSWETQGVVEGKGTTTIRNTYSMIDEKPAFGENYYRLKQVDFDGTFTYSSVVSIDFGKPTVNIFPNPVVDEVTIALDEKVSGNLEVFSVTGQVIKRVAVEAQEQVNVDLSAFLTGVYFIRLVDQNGLLIDSELLVKK